MSKIDIQKLKAMGFNLMPLKKESKEPIPGVSWKRLQNEKYNGEFPDSCNVAVICGQISDNLFVVDLDKDDLFEQFKEYHDKTYIVKTGRGYHIYFKSNTFCPPNKKFDDYRFRHIDIKSDGGYVLAEGSIHPDTKKPYECISSKPILRINPKEIMDKLQEMGFNVQKQSFEDISKGVIEGGRNDATFKYACYLVRDKGLYGEALRKEVEELNKRHKPPLPQSEIDIILKQAEGYEAKNVKKSKEIISMESLRERLKKMDQESINLSSDLPEFTRVLGEDTVEGIIKEVKGDIPIHRSQKLNLRDINPVLHEGILVEFDAMITAIGNRQTYNVEADFVCPGKGEVKHLTCDAYRRMETPHCAKHKCRYNIDLDSRKTVFVQQMNIQEFLESAKNNSPVHYQAEIYGDNVGKAFMGERKTFLGKFRSLPPKGNKNTYNDVVFDILEMKDLDQQPGCMPTNEELEKWKNDPKIFDKVVNSFAPDVLIDPTLIESVVLYMSGGTTINGKRALIHECIIGDAQLGKSEIAKRVHDIILGSGYVDGTNCSVPGITVGMATMYDGMQIPQAGTLPQHTGYPVVFDEGDKASPEVLKSLYNCMESGFATLTKVGYAGTTYPTKNEILFLANPKNGKFSLKGNRTIMDNFSMETPFISRFDIIWLLIDKNDPEEDKRIRNHIRNYRQKVGEYMTTEELQRYFTYVRSIEAHIPEEIEDKIDELHEEMRPFNVEVDGISIGWRQYHGLYRLITASAKAHLRTVATEEDFKIVKNIIQKSFESLKMDLQSGKSGAVYEKSKSAKENTFNRVVDSIMDESGEFDKEELIEELGKHEPFSPIKAQEEWGKYERQGLVEKNNNTELWRLSHRGKLFG